jgi:hypothetical protein
MSSDLIERVQLAKKLSAIGRGWEREQRGETIVVTDAGRAALRAPVLPFDEPEDWADPGVCASWHSGFAYAETYRKVTLAHCRELERAKATAKSEKYSEARLDDLAHTNELYLDYLARMLQGRYRYEQNVREQMGAR